MFIAALLVMAKNWKATQMSTYSRTYNEIVVHSYKGIQNNENEQTITIWNNTGESHKHNVEQKKLGKKEYVLYVFTYITSKIDIIDMQPFRIQVSSYPWGEEIVIERGDKRQLLVMFCVLIWVLVT